MRALVLVMQTDAKPGTFALGIATFIALRPGKGVAGIYRMSPTVKDWDGNEHLVVCVSAVMVHGEPETYLFPATEDGNITDWGELPGSRKGTLLHEDTLLDMGYAIEGAKS